MPVQRAARVTIGDRVIGPGERCFIIAEAGVNHDGSLERAAELVEAAARTGADAVKFQTFSTDRLVAPAAPAAQYQRERTGHGDQRSMLESLELDRDAHAHLAALARDRGIEFLSSPFDHGSVDLLVDVGVRAIKLGSGELTNDPLLAHAAATGLPLIVSTGMSELEEVDRAVAALPTGTPLVLLHCVSAYPAEPDDLNLAVIATMAARYEVPIGFSDHTRGIGASVAAVALGATVIEKHLTLDKRSPGPDHAASLEPDELAVLVGACRDAERSVGLPVKRIADAEREIWRVARRSVFVVRDVAQGEALERADLDVLRPATGMPPSRLEEVIGRRVATAISAGTPLTDDLLG